MINQEDQHFLMSLVSLVDASNVVPHVLVLHLPFLVSYPQLLQVWESQHFFFLVVRCIHLSSVLIHSLVDGQDRSKFYRLSIQRGFELGQAQFLNLTIKKFIDCFPETQIGTVEASWLLRQKV